MHKSLMPCFPFNRPHEHASEHQNRAIIGVMLINGNNGLMQFVIDKLANDVMDRP